MERNEEKQRETDIVVKSKMLTKLDNFWYHYKWVVIVAAFFVVVVSVCFVQCATKDTADLSVVFAGGTALNGEQQEKICRVFDSLAPKKEDGTPLTTALIAHSIYTDEEIRVASTDEKGEFSASTFNSIKQVTNNHLSTFGTYVQSGESGIWLVSEYAYEARNLQKLARPLDTLFDTVPDSAYDGYAIRLAETDLYQTYDVLKVLPEDTLIVMSEKLVVGAISNDTYYQQQLALYHAIVGFQAP